MEAVKNPACKILVRHKGKLTMYEVIYRNKSEGQFLDRANAVKLANAYEKLASTGHVHT